MLEPYVFELLKNILSESRGIEFNFFENNDISLNAMDMGIRVQLQQSDILYDQIRNVIRPLAFGEIIIMRDTLMLTSLVFKSDPDKESFYSIGPFRSLPLEDDDYASIKVKNGLTMSKAEELRIILQPVPCNIMRAEALAIAKNILLTSHKLDAPSVREIDFEKQSSDILPLVPTEDINIRAKKIEDVYLHEERLLSYISEGNEQKALQEAQFFTNSKMEQRLPNRLLSHRSLLYSTNTLCRKAVQNAGIHPLYLDEISQSFAKKLAICTTHEQLDEIYFEMISKYCRFYREHPAQKYSPPVQKAVNYISLNLSEDITQYNIAEAVNFSPGYISRKFKEEVGMSITSYISEQRVTTAKRLLEKSSMTVREISVYVGMTDWNYFTKVFKKAEGVTPTEYRKSLKPPQ